MRPHPIALILFVLALAACRDEPRTEPADYTSVEDTASSQPTPAAAPEHLIRADGIGHATIGMTIGALRAALPPDLTLGASEPFMVDIDALPVMQGGDTLYYVLFPVGEVVNDSSVIELLATLNPRVRTADGIGPNTPLATVAALAGPPRLNYSTNDESREWAEFPYLNPEIMVRVGPLPDGSFVGTYSTAGEYNETSIYEPEARVMMIVVRK